MQPQTATWLCCIGAATLLGCATAGNDPDSGPGGTIDASTNQADALPGLVDAPVGSPDAAIIIDAAPLPDADPGSTTATLHQQSNGNPNSVSAGNAIACVATDAAETMQWNSDNRYFRVYDLSVEGITSTFNITKVEYGVESADGGADATQTGTVKIHTVSGTANPPALTDLSQVASQPITIADGSLAIRPVTIAASIPGSTRFAVELAIPASDDTNLDVFFVGTNTAGQTNPSYLVSTGCGVATMTDMSTLGTAGPRHMILKVTGNYTP